MSSEPELHVVLGGSGGVGSAVVRELVAQGLQVRSVNRTGSVPYLPDSVDVRVGEAVVIESLRAACEGASIIYHCLHPHRDMGLLAPETGNIVTVAAEMDVPIVAAQAVFLYGRVSGPVREETPIEPADPLGRAHAKAAAILTDAHESGTARVVIGRAAHLYGSYLRRFWCGLDPFAALEGTPATVYGDLDAPHSYMFVDDFARGLVTLAQSDASFGRVWHVPAAPSLSVRQLLTILYEAAGQPLRLRHRSWARLRLGSAVSREQELVRSLLYQFSAPYEVDHSRFIAAYEFTPTPHARALRQTVEWCRDLTEAAVRRAGFDTLEGSGSGPN